MKKEEQNKKLPLKETGDMQTIENSSSSQNVKPEPQPKDYDEIEY
ncbi:hypothetical protein [Rossellomorea aquimaris]|nr:hypothetical protein [Rossellomorea aquimaris]